MSIATEPDEVYLRLRLLRRTLTHLALAWQQVVCGRRGWPLN